ncbi:MULTISPECIES: hypothetical protein [unclassified Methylobacterium]|uniref:hypothetical protein n=1 Tax=unclassified Methylobacterium TaxID=2615210 RepID=UPI000AAB8F3A|nr:MULTISPECIES: hypothetical protein [unclassified Methylobacterium]
MSKSSDNPRKAVAKKPTPDDGLTQSERFIKAAQELGTDDDPERFKETIRKVARTIAAPVKNR